VTGAALPLFKPGASFHYTAATREGDVEIRSIREHQGRLLIALEGVEDATAAESFVGAALYAAKDDIPLDAGEYLDDDLIACDVFGAGGRHYGKVERVEHYPASDMLVVEGKMVPMVSAIVREIDLERRRITIDPPAGLLD
jgi:16S rRNA processing protein RimM